MPGLFDAFEPLDPTSVNSLLDYNKKGAVDDIAQTLVTKKEFNDLLPATVRPTLKNRDDALRWLCDLIPDPTKRTGDWRLYFVKNYAQMWVKKKYVGSELLAAAIGTQIQAARGLKADMAYYTENRQVSVPASNTHRGEFDAHVGKKWQGIKQIGWRGDDRHPKLMMQSGFSPRVSVTSPIWRPQENNMDVDLDTTVCVARDIRGSAFFPLSKPVTSTWAYCVLIREGWNTYYLQKQLAAERGQTPGTAAYNKTVWMFHEKCVNKVEPVDIVLVIELERRIFDGKSPLSGIQFRLKDCTGRINGDTWAGLDGQQKDKVEQTVQQFMGSWYPSDGRKWLTYDGIVEK